MLILLASVLFAGPAQQPASVAMVLRIKGEVSLIQPGHKPARAWAMDLLRPGDRLAVPAGGEAHLFFLDDGHKEVLAAGKTATVQAAGCKPPAAVARKLPCKLGKRALEDLKRRRPPLARVSSFSYKLGKLALKDLKGDLAAGRLGGVLLRGADDPLPPVLTPLPGANVLSPRPALSWPAVEGAKSYIVALFTGPDTKDLQKVWRIETKANRLPFPAKQADLQSVTYRWSVVARLKDDDREIVSLKQARFSVATKREVRLLQEAKKLAESSDPADVLLAVGLYESRAVHDEALKLYEKLVKQAPEQARFHEALARYYEAGGRAELAKKERDTAARLRKQAAKK